MRFTARNLLFGICNSVALSRVLRTQPIQILSAYKWISNPKIGLRNCKFRRAEQSLWANISLGILSKVNKPLVLLDGTRVYNFSNSPFTNSANSCTYSALKLNSIPAVS